MFSSLLELRLQLIAWVAFSLCRSKAFLFSTTLRWQNCSFPTLLGKTFKKSNLLKIFAQLSVRLLFFLFIQFSMNIPHWFYPTLGGLKWTRVTLQRTASYTQALRARLIHLTPRRLTTALVGSSGLEPPTSRLSGARSNQLSYEPMCMVCSHSSFARRPSPAWWR